MEKLKIKNEFALDGLRYREVKCIKCGEIDFGYYTAAKRVCQTCKEQHRIEVYHLKYSKRKERTLQLL